MTTLEHSDEKGNDTFDTRGWTRTPETGEHPLGSGRCTVSVPRPLRPSIMLCLAIAASAGMVGCGEGADTARSVAVMEARFDSFIASFPGELSYTATVREVVGDGTDTRALGKLIADNFYVINETSVNDTRAGGTGFEQLTSDDNQAVADNHLVPMLVSGAVVVSVDWTLGSETVTSYAIISPDAADPGNPDDIFDGPTSFYRPIDTSPAVISSLAETDSSTFGPKRFLNGFGSRVASYSAEIHCNDFVLCGGSAEGNDAGPCSAHVKFQNPPACVGPGFCQMTYAFEGTCGFPDVKLSADGTSFEVSGWGWSYYSKSGTLECSCDDCTP